MDKTSECYSKAEKAIMAIMDTCGALRDENVSLTKERDALAERVRLGDELKRALDSWLLTGDGWEDVGAARAAIAERDDDDL